MQDICLPYECDDGTLTKDNPLRRISTLSVEAGKVAGRPLDLPPKYKTYLQKAGFVDVVERRIKWPLNQWAKDPHHKLIGTWVRENFHIGIEGLLMALFTRHLGWTREEVLIASMEFKDALKDHSTHAYIPV